MPVVCSRPRIRLRMFLARASSSLRFATARSSGSLHSEVRILLLARVSIAGAGFKPEVREVTAS